ncbi:MAG: T9SS type A sorting domain-containing protein [Ignavibacteriota bacterium]
MMITTLMKLMKCIFLIAFVLCIAFFSTNVSAQFWQQTNGPDGGDIKGFAINTQGHLFVLSNSLMRSIDNGNSWLQIGTEMPNYQLTDIQISPTGELYVLESGGSTYHAIWKSSNNGNTWSRLQNSPLIYSLSITPNGIILAISANQKDFFQSSDKGATWTQFQAAIVGQPTILWGNKAGDFFLSSDAAFYRSTDQGQNWSKIINGITSAINTIAEDANGILYTGISANYHYPEISKLLFKSTDGGRLWVVDSLSIYKDYSQELDKIFISPQGKIAILTDNYLAISDDNGKNWRTDGWYNLMGTSNLGIFYFTSSSTLTRSDLNIGSIKEALQVPNGKVTSILKHSKGNLLADGWLSTDNGKHWSGNPGGGITFANAIDSLQNIFKGSGGSILRSTDGGLSWIANSSTLTLGVITAIDVKQSGEIFAASSLEGVFRSTDHGITWDQTILGMKDQHIFSLAIHQNGDLYAGSENIIYKSTNAGLTWNVLNTNFPVKSGNVTSLVVSSQGNIIAGIDKAGVYWSTDIGTTWSEKASGLTATRINALVSTPSGKVFAGTEKGVFFLDIIPSATWLNFDQGLTATNVLALCRDQSGRIFAGTDVSGVFSSLQTFNIAYPGGSLNAPLLSKPSNNSSNDADSVKLEWNSVPNAKSYQISLSSSQDFSALVGGWNYVTDTTFVYKYVGAKTTLYWRVQAIGDNGASLLSEVWSFTMNATSDVSELNSSRLFTSLGTNYPNPFSASTTIPFTIGEKGNVTIEVFDPLGQICAIIANGIYEQGNYEAKFNGEQFSEGTYFVRLRTEKQSFTKVLELIK